MDKYIRFWGLFGNSKKVDIAIPEVEGIKLGTKEFNDACEKHFSGNTEKK